MGRSPSPPLARFIAALLAARCLIAPASSLAADHNDPNAVNSIFSDIEVSPADLYDFFGFPADDTTGGQRVVLALTFASVPQTGVLDPDLLYRIMVAPAPRLDPHLADDESLAGMLRYIRAIKDRYLKIAPHEVRVAVDAQQRARLRFSGFPGGDFQTVVELNRAVTVGAPGGDSIQVFVGGRDDAFFNDLPGFFRSINYAPQFYHVPLAMKGSRELKIPKTLLELDGNRLFNFDPANPRHGQGVKLDLPQGPLNWKADHFSRDAQGNYRFVYSGKDAQAGRNINAVILEIPLRYITRSPATERIVNAWGESWVLKAANKVETIPDDRPVVAGPLWIARPWLFPSILVLLATILIALGWPAAPRGTAMIGSTIPAPVKKTGSRSKVIAGVLLLVAALLLGGVATMLARQKPDLSRTAAELDSELRNYKLVDTDGQPFADAALNEREDDRQLGAYDFWLGPHFVTRLAHLGWGFGPSISALGLETAFDHDHSPVSVYRDVTNPAEAFPRVRKVIFQQLNMPDDSWNRSGEHIALRRPIEIFIPNVCAIDMGTTGTWPFGRRPEDQVATRFLSLFLDMKAKLGGRPYTIETLSDQSLWDHAPIEPRTPPNPLANDKPFLGHFPYLADPW